jgi:hypothetical protein
VNRFQTRALLWLIGGLVATAAVAYAIYAIR